jgi:hypothetical protein
VEEEKGMRPRKWETVYEDGQIGRDPEKPEWFWFVKVTNLADACGEKEAEEMSGRKGFIFMAEVELVPSWKSLSREQQKEVISSTIGEEDWTKNRDKYAESALAEMTASYGIGTMACMMEQYGKTPGSAKKRALAEANWDVEHALNRIVNKIGMTGREWIANDMTSCMERGKIDAGKPRTVKKAGPKEMPEGMSGVTRSINQKDLSGECWNIQVWGPDKCETCEFKGTPECGGQNIRRTDHNEKGILVPIPDKT